MKKVLLLSLIIIVSLLFFLLFNDKGNEYLKPYVARYLESKAEQNITVQVEHLKIDYNYIELTALLNKLTTIHTYGEVLILNKKLNLNYTLSFIDKIDMNGTLKGTFDNIKITGKGDALQSQLNYDLNYQNKSLHNIHIKISKADISELLLLTAQPAYANGEMDIDITIPKFDMNKSTGEAHMVLYDTTLNEKVINREFKTKLPKNTKLKGVLNSTINNNQIAFHSTLKSNLATLKLEEAHYHLNSNDFFSNYHLNIPKLSRLNRVVGKNLKGKLSLDGKIKFNKTLLLTGNTKDLGGLLNFKLHNEELTSHINKVSVEKLMYLLEYPQIFKATINGDFNYNQKTRQGTFNSKLNQAQLLPNALTQLVQQVRGVDLTKERYNKTTFIAHLNEDTIHFDFNAKSRKVLISLPNAEVNKLTNSINADYKLKIEKREIEGKIQGDITKPHITIDSSKFIQEQIFETITDSVGEDKLKELGIGKKERETIKNILGDLFK